MFLLKLNTEHIGKHCLFSKSNEGNNCVLNNLHIYLQLVLSLEFAFIQLLNSFELQVKKSD